MKYHSPADQNEILPNLLNLTDKEEIAFFEFQGFLEAEVFFMEKLSPRTKFNTSYILKIHKLALGHLYEFAGKYRNVNISKGGFPFAAAKFLHPTMKAFNDEILLKIPNSYKSKESLIIDISKVHGELLLIHPFREGNGRTARVLANLMAIKQGYGSIQFEKIDAAKFELYVAAVQQCAERNYGPMEELIRSIFPN